MDLNVRNYRIKDEIIINCFDTWSNSMQNLLNDSYKIIEKYRKREKEILELKEKYKREDKIYEIFCLRNEYYGIICDLKEKFYNILLSENKDIICFHASRYTNKEKDRIYKYGLKTSSKYNIFERIENLLKDGYINDEESKFLKENNLLIEQDCGRENQIWVTIGNENISYSTDSGLYSLYNNYGGEIQYFCIENSILGNKLNKLSKPCLIILKLNTKQIEEYSLQGLIDNIFSNINFENSELVGYDLCTKAKNVLIEDIIEINENSRIIF